MRGHAVFTRADAAIQGAINVHIDPTGQDAYGGDPPSPLQPTLHQLPPEPRPQCCPDGQSASVVQGLLTQPASLPGEQAQL